MTFLDKFTIDEIKSIIKESFSYGEVLIKMNISSNSGSNRILLSRYIKDNNLDISHFPKMTKRTPENIFIKDSTATQIILKRYYLKGNYTEYKCSICGQEPIWNGKPLTLTLDHINGVNNDNRFENLRWVCPNCDRQLPTFGSKNRLPKPEIKCEKCKKILHNKPKSGLCFECYQKYRNDNKKISYISYNKKDLCPLCNNFKLETSTHCIICSRKIKKDEHFEKLKLIISRDTLKDLIRKIAFTEIARNYNVTKKTVIVWCKKYNLPYKKCDITTYSDKEWEKI